jgi:7-carboxy-7-deazaguanine synthase
VTCSPKQGAKLCISRMDEVKVVYEGQDIAVYESLPAGHFFLQPCSCSNTAETVACVMQHPKWRLSLQTHRLIEIK